MIRNEIRSSGLHIQDGRDVDGRLSRTAKIWLEGSRLRALPVIALMADGIQPGWTVIQKVTLEFLPRSDRTGEAMARLNLGGATIELICSISGPGFGTTMRRCGYQPVSDGYHKRLGIVYELSVVGRWTPSPMTSQSAGMILNAQHSRPARIARAKNGRVGSLLGLIPLMGRLAITCPILCGIW